MINDYIKGVNSPSFFFVIIINSLCFFFPKSIFANEKPNIVLIIADDLGWNDLGCYGNSIVATPNIDRIAKGGLKFTNAYLTTSSCSPSRASIITGRYPHNTGFPEFTFNGGIADELPVLPELLKKAGYYTAQAGKWHLDNVVFDSINKDDIGPGGESNWVTTLKNRPKNKPFFMWFASTDPHRKWGANQFRGSNNPDNITPPPFLANTAETRQDLAKYYDEITRFDFYVGEVEKELQRQGVLNNTVIIIISDNGRAFPRCKTRLYDSGIKTPLIIKWVDGIDSVGIESSSMVSVIDIAPTLLDIADGNIPKSFQGKSFKTLLNKPQLNFRTYIFAEHNWHGFETHERMVRTNSFMYIINRRPSLSNPPPMDAIKSPSFDDLIRLKGKGQLTDAQADIFITPRPYEELFNCIDDPYQIANVASLPEYKEVLSSLRNIMIEWQQDTHDTTPENLTPDWVDRETGELLDLINNEPGEHLEHRGENPGGPRALTITSGGPF
ncbi:sulfatase [Membranicola marinus]|uniref:Sulfatase n=1 Tax=Membranihabitans marinus TaxID=1227546 RepID=A0A953HPN7_9BACT|nr:sulfatase [Membranihabitans marinus]MBY5958954.1 sulfatase [Membranihabitans marinus]